MILLFLLLCYAIILIGDVMSKYVDSIIGHAIGDAMGVPTEFRDRETLLMNPVVEMKGYGSHFVPAGSWSDDTSMEIATIDSFIEKGCFDYYDIMTKFLKWINNGEYTATGEVFDVGRTCLKALNNFNNGIEPLKCAVNSENYNGNGSLMRILPVALYSYSKKLKEEDIISLTNDISSLTHSHNISKLGCYIYVRYVIFLLEGLSKEEAYKKIQSLDYNSYGEDAINCYDRILKNNISDLSLDDIKSTGYVVDTLEASLWIVLHADSYRDAIIASTNIGNDTDTIGAVTGSMAGIIYGIDIIPESWLDKLLRKDYLIDLATKFEEKVEC